MGNGTAAMPLLLLSRYEFIRLAQTYRKKDIPCDVLYYDIHYMDEYKVFTWDKDRFPDPKRLNQEAQRPRISYGHHC